MNWPSVTPTNPDRRKEEEEKEEERGER